MADVIDILRKYSGNNGEILLEQIFHAKINRTPRSAIGNDL